MYEICVKVCKDHLLMMLSPGVQQRFTKHRGGYYPSAQSNTHSLLGSGGSKALPHYCEHLWWMLKAAYMRTRETRAQTRETRAQQNLLYIPEINYNKLVK